MRSLVLLEVSAQELVSAASNHQVGLIAHDASTGDVYAVSSSRDEGSGVAEILVWRLSEGVRKETVAEWIADTPEHQTGATVVALNYLPESDSLCVVLSNGDIEQIFEPGLPNAKRENVGSVEDGIRAAVWSPDEELLALATGDDKLIVMTKDFEVLSEGPLRTTEFGEDAPVNVGWGEKSTQFHGSVGKSAAASGPSTDSLEPSPDDDGISRISWRGDSKFFGVSSLDFIAGATRPRRVVRTFSRTGVLSSTNEPTSGLGHPLSWQPSGSIIASTQKRLRADGSVASHHVVFFERNGLRRYDFPLRESDVTGESQRCVKELAWNADSSLLGVWIRRQNQDVVQLWHRNNYHWYLKQEITSRLCRQTGMSSFSWHPEKGLELSVVTASGIESFKFCWDIFASPQAPPSDNGAVAVVDGANLNLTPFRLVNIPPPMSALTLLCRASHVPVHISFSASSPHFAVLYSDGIVELWRWATPVSLRGKDREEIVAPSRVSVTQVLEQDATPTQLLQCACLGDETAPVIAVLLAKNEGSTVVIWRGGEELERVDLLGGARKLVAGLDDFFVETAIGSLVRVNSSSEDLPGLPEFCSWLRRVELPSLEIIVGLSESGRLYADSNLISSDCTSFTCSPDFLVFTTFSHEAKFVPLFTLDPSYSGSSILHTETLPQQPAKSADSATIRRAVERGSRIVTVVPSSTSLVLQMPRGNLETISPRPLVLQVVRHQIDNCRFRAAFLLCRRHRLDLNILHDHNPQTFREHLGEFVKQVKGVDYLNLFLSGLKDEDVTLTMYRPLQPPPHKPEDMSLKVNTVCDLVRKELENLDSSVYTNTILTSHVRKKPPDYESALQVLAALKIRSVTEAEEAVKYIIFLSDADKLFDLALGMYDFSLVLLIAQNSQKDPREYLPFLRDLRKLEHFIQRFKIDDHLGRHDSALRNLAQAGAERFDDALAYTKQHALYSTSLEVFRDDPAKYKIVLVSTAENRMEEKHYAEAGLLYTLGGQPASAAQAYQKAYAWRELFNLLLTEKRPAAEIKATALEVATGLKSKRRFAEAGRVLLEYARDVEAAVEALVEGGEFTEALRLTSLYNRRELIETSIKLGTVNVQSRLVDDISEVTEQVEKQLERLSELDEKKNANPAHYFGADGPTTLDNVELQPDGASDAGTAFTRYTAAPTTAATSRVTGTSSRSRRRGGLKKAAGKKGTIYEELYLLRSLKKTVEQKLVELQTEVSSLLPVLLTLGSSVHRSAAVTLQSDLIAFEVFLMAQVDAAWAGKSAEWEREVKEAEARGRLYESELETPPADENLAKVDKPKLSGVGQWKIGLLDALLL